MRGTSLLELLVVLTLVGLASGVAVARVGSLRDRLVVEHQAATVLTAYQRARLTALTGSLPVILHLGPDRIAAYAVSGPDSVLAWSDPGPAAAGVSLTGPARVVFAPSGITMGVANGRYVLDRGGIRRTLVASRLGRLRVARPRRRRASRPRPGSGGPSGSGSSGRCRAAKRPAACCPR